MDKCNKKKADSKGATFGLWITAKLTEAHNIDYNDPEKPKNALEHFYALSSQYFSCFGYGLVIQGICTTGGVRYAKILIN